MRDPNSNGRENNVKEKSSSHTTPLTSESRQLSMVARDVSVPQVKRVEAYKDIIDLEVGDTSLSRARNIERETGFRQLYLKFEGGNPTGTQKDRIAFSHCLDALRRGFDTITVASCGNYGVSLALASQLAGVECIIRIPENYHGLRVDEMISSGAKVIRTAGSYEDCVRISSEEAEEMQWYDANPGGANTSLQIMAYAEISYEIYDQLRDAPRVIAGPVSNGTMLAGIYSGFASLFKRGKTSRIPAMVGASSTRKNPIVSSFIKGYEHCKDLIPEKVKETKINEPLINWHSFDGEEALNAIYQSRGAAFNVSDEKMSAASRKLKNLEGLHVLPASTAGLVALQEFDKIHDLEPDRYVAVLTSRK